MEICNILDQATAKRARLGRRALLTGMANTNHIDTDSFIQPQVAIKARSEEHTNELQSQISISYSHFS
jgi:hypothetical protein